MSAPTPATGDGSPTPGYYPDPSIPGYIRYWNGAAWVPGTSRPAPKDGEAVPLPPAAAVPAPAAVPPQAPVPAVEETGPVFLDEEPVAEERPEPASVWQADVAYQTGFGGDRDRRVSWGAERRDGPVPAGFPSSAPADGRPAGGQPPEPEAVSSAAPEGTVTIRATKPKPKQEVGAGAEPRSRQDRPADGAPAVRAPKPDAPRTPQVPAQAQPQPQAQPLPAPVPVQPAPAPVRPAAAQPAPAQPAPVRPASAQPAPVPLQPMPAAPAPAAGAGESWVQQVHQLARPAEAEARPGAQQQPVVPWKPPVEDPFLRAARDQASARPAALGKRLVARLIDTVVLGAAAVAVAVPFVSRALDHIDGKIQQAKQSGETVTVWLVDGTTSAYFGIALAALLVLGTLYEALPTATWGRTLGKRLCGLEVRDIESHERPSFGAALRRWLVHGVLGILAIGVVNVLWCLFDRPWRQCWHDKAARTFVAGG